MNVPNNLEEIISEQISASHPHFDLLEKVYPQLTEKVPHTEMTFACRLSDVRSETHNSQCHGDKYNLVGILTI